VAFVFFTVSMEFAPTPAAIASVALTFVFRMLSIVLNWRTAPVSAING